MLRHMSSLRWSGSRLVVNLLEMIGGAFWLAFSLCEPCNIDMDLAMNLVRGSGRCACNQHPIGLTVWRRNR